MTTPEQHKNLFIAALETLAALYPYFFKYESLDFRNVFSIDEAVKKKTTRWYLDTFLPDQDDIDMIMEKIGWEYEVTEFNPRWTYCAWKKGAAKYNDLTGEPKTWWETKQSAAQAALIAVVSHIRKTRSTDTRSTVIAKAHAAMVLLFPNNSVSSVCSNDIQNVLEKVYEADREVQPSQKIPGILAGVNEEIFRKRMSKAWQGAHDAYDALESLRPGGGF
jgi:hypothetical protein